MIRYLLFLILILGGFQVSFATMNPNLESKSKKEKKEELRKARLRMDCNQATQSIDMAINNVRARLLNGGDVWWNRTDGRYIVPKVETGSGEPERSSIYAGAVWLGGLDDSDNLKVAVQTYGSSQGTTDFWPGPLNSEGTVDETVCSDWDKFFVVNGEDIDLHLSQFETARTAGIDYDENLIPESIKSWPARGNDFFFDIYEFDLPDTDQGLGAFFDQDGDGAYEPQEGDYPIIEIAGCDDPQYPDQMIFWIYNDAGGLHTQSNGDAIRMEVQVQAFAYETNDEVNNMTFQRYKLINRAVASIDSTYFAMWVDPDLGCSTDDYIGCDIDRSLAIVYNEDAQDGQPGCNCEDAVPTYCNQVPLLGVDYFRGPRDEFGEELGMSSFTYYNNGRFNPPTPGTTDPSEAQEYYNYLSGSWLDGTPFSFGGEGYDPTSTNLVDYAFPDVPDDLSGWSMCTAALPFGDRRTIQATGPFRLDPGAKNELIIGVVWVPEADYPCPDISALINADELAQGLFDSCFDILDGPDAPNVDWIELNNEVIAVLTNENIVTNNNRFEDYEEIDPLAPKDIPLDDRKYKFEGYHIFQLASANVGRGEYDNPDRARIIETVDVKNGVREIYTWSAVDNVSSNPLAPKEIYVPTLRNELATDEGIRHTFRILEDQFAEGSGSARDLINHKEYYYSVVAYSYNQYEEFFQDGGVLTGQRRAYLEGRQNIQTYTVVPRPIVDAKLNAEFGEGAQITRLAGAGVGGNLVDITDETRMNMLNPDFDGRIIYEKGRGPFEVKIYNPIEAVNGRFQLRVVDGNLNDDVLENDATWILTNLDDNEEVLSDETLELLNEQIIAKFGFSILIGQTGFAGDKSESNGAIGAEVEYLEVVEEDDQWLGFQEDTGGSGLEGIFNFVRTAFDEEDDILDPRQALSQVGNGTFYPFFLTYFGTTSDDNPYISPAWQDNAARLVRGRSDLTQLNNVDIVFTKDKSKWSRCVIVESASGQWTDPSVNAPTFEDTDQFEVRPEPSVGKEDSNNDGLPDPDGAVDEDGDPLLGMGWFPGYAVDVETGKRVNIFFGENSTYSADNLARAGGESAYTTADIGGKYLGEDMMFNPSSQRFLNAAGRQPNIYDLIMGGHHFIYVTDQEYDECADIYERLQSSRSSTRANGIANVKWTAIPILQNGQEMTSYAEGLIPNDVVVKLRVDQQYRVTESAGVNNGYPTYEFAFSDVEPSVLTTEVEVNEQLDAINVVPNPYYGYSAYERTQFETNVKITNLPAACTVTIYSLDGKFIRQYVRNEVGIDQQIFRNSPGIRSSQINPAIVWDIKNNKGIPVASGTYLIHVDAGDLGERVIKWFGIARQFDPTGL